MKVAQIQGTCRCETQGFEEYALPDRTLGAVDVQGAPMWSRMCSTCGAPGHVRAVELIGEEPIGPLADHELIELMWEREELREQIASDELRGPSPWPPAMERHDALACAEELAELEHTLEQLQRSGRVAMPDQLRRRQSLRRTARGLLATAAF